MRLVRLNVVISTSRVLLDVTRSADQHGPLRSDENTTMVSCCIERGAQGEVCVALPFDAYGRSSSEKSMAIDCCPLNWLVADG